MMQADSVEAVRLAVLNFTVHAIGIAIIGAVYLNFVLIKVLTAIE